MTMPRHRKDDDTDLCRASHCCACLHFACTGEHESTGCEFCDASVHLWPVVLDTGGFMILATSDHFPDAAPEVIGFASATTTT